MMRNEGIQPDTVTYNTLISKAKSNEEAEGWLKIMSDEGIEPNVVTYNTRMSIAENYAEAESWLKIMRDEGIEPSLVTYNTLISKSQSHHEANRWLKIMRLERIEPNIVTYKKLISKAENYEEAKGWLHVMHDEGIQPDNAIYTTLISKAENYEEAKGWLKIMSDEGVQPDSMTYETLFSKDLSGCSADRLIGWFLLQEYHPDVAIQAAIASYRKSGLLDEAIRLCLDYPHLQAARKVIRDHGEKVLTYFRGIADRNHDHPNAHYALGVALMELGREKDARLEMRRALKLANPGSRKTMIRVCLRQIDEKLSRK